MKLVKPNIKDIPKLLLVTRACAAQMIANGIQQWNEFYPSKEVFEKDVALEQLWVLKDEERIVGSIVISSIIDEAYKTVSWLTPNEKNIYIHRLAIHPEYQGKRLAQYLMTFAEQYAKGHDYVSVRLDTFSQNARNNIFYTKRGYKKLGDVYFPNQSEHPFHCYELVL